MSDPRGEMNRRNQQKRGALITFKEGRHGGGPTDEDLNRLYGELVFGDVLPLLEELGKKGKDIQLESDRIGHIREHMGPQFADAIYNRKRKIGAAVPEEHRGALDGWIKRIARKEFGGTSDFAMEHGDQELNFLCITLSNQAGRVADLRAGEKVLGREVPDTKKAWCDIGPELEQKLEQMKGEFEAAKKSGSPKMSDPQFLDEAGKLVFPRYLAAQTAHTRLMKTGEARIIYTQGVVNRIKEWATSRREDKEGKEKSKKDVVAEKIATAMDQLQSLKAEEDAAAGRGEYGIAAGKKTERMQLEGSVRELEKEYAELVEAESKAPEGAGTTASPKPGEGEPMGSTPRVNGDAEAAKAKAGDVAGKISALKAEMAKLQANVDVQMQAADAHRAKAEELYTEADAVRKSDRPKALRLDAEANSHEESALTAEGLASKLTDELTEMAAALGALEAQVSAPAEPKAQRRGRGNSKAKPAATTTEEVTGTGNGAQPGAEAAEVVAETPAVTPPAGSNGAAEITQKSVLGMIKAAQLGAQTTDALVARIVKGDDLVEVHKAFTEIQELMA